MSNYDDMLNVQADPLKDKRTSFAEESRENRNRCYEMAERTTLAVAEHADVFQQYLNLQSRFDRYTPNNVLLLLAQNPDAQKLGDYGYWREQGVFVKRKESNHPILIMEPGKEYEREDGSIGTYYNAKKLYDISQTTYSERSIPIESIDERLLIRALVNNPPANIVSTEPEQMPDEKGAFFKPEEGCIYVRKGMSAQEIFQNLVPELVFAGYADGNHQETFNGEERLVTVKTVGYTGWKIVGVTPMGGVSFNNVKSRLLIVFIVFFVVFLLAIINSYISRKITKPIEQLERSVNEIEAGKLETEVHAEGSYEIQHLGASIQNMARQIRRLMDDIVAEHESKRKNEFDVLQSQINPHFLYNTLDIIVWMIENEKQSEAVKAVTALARFFRISLSRGKSIISVRDELEHVRNYLTIQHMRFKNRFTYTIEADDEVLELASLKLILQPLVENAIYHGMEFMDGDGEIRIRAFREGEDLYMTVSDNGLGMTEEQAERILHDTSHVPSSHGSGIGVRNVNERIKLYFGKEYGLTIQSELDVGTMVTIHLRAVPYERVEKGEELHDK